MAQYAALLRPTIMPNYRRVFVPGGCWFFTATLLDRRSSLLTDHIELLREATRRTQQRFPFHIDAMTILPDHIHAVWTLPPGDADFSVRWRWIKIRFARAIPREEYLSPTTYSSCAGTLKSRDTRWYEQLSRVPAFIFVRARKWE